MPSTSPPGSSRARAGRGPDRRRDQAAGRRRGRGRARRPLAVKGRAEPVHGLATRRSRPRGGGSSPPARRADARPRRELSALRRAFERVSRERTPQRVDGDRARPGSGSRGSLTSCRTAVGDEASVLRRQLPALRRGNHVLAARRDRARRPPATEPRAAIAELLGGRAARADLIADRVMQAAGLSEGAATGRDLTWAVRRFFEALARRPPAGARFRGHPLGGAAAARPDRVPDGSGARRAR